MFAMDQAKRIRALELSNAELRAALILAGKEIRKLNFGRQNSEVLKILRRTLRNARAVARPGNSPRVA
jgi:hypothetical protein